MSGANTNQGNGAPMYTTLPNVRGLFYEGQDGQHALLPQAQFTWQLQQPPLPPPPPQQPTGQNLPGPLPSYASGHPHLPPSMPPQPLPTTDKKKQLLSVARSGGNLHQQQWAGDGMGANHATWYGNGGGQAPGLQRSESANSAGSGGGGGRKRANGQEVPKGGGVKRAKSDGQYQPALMATMMQGPGGHNLAPANGMAPAYAVVPTQQPRPAASAERKKSGGRAHVNKNQQAGGEVAAAPATASLHPPLSSTSRPHGVSPRAAPPSHHGAGGYVPPPDFFPYTPLPANLNPMDLRNPSFLRVLKNFAAKPSLYLGSQKEALLMDLRRASDLVKGQKDFIEHQLSLLEAWKDQAFSPAVNAPRAPTPKHKGDGGLGGGDLAGNIEPGLFEGDIFGGLFDEDDVVWEGLEVGDDVAQLEHDVSSLPNQPGGGGGGGASRPPSALPPGQRDIGGQQKAKTAAARAVLADLPTTIPTASKEERPRQVPKRAVRIRLRCDSIGPMKKKERTLFATFLLSEEDIQQGIIPSPLGKKKGGARAEASGGPVEQLPGQQATGAAPPKANRKHKKKPAASDSAVGAAAGQGHAGGGAVEVKETPFYDRLDSFAEFEYSPQYLWDFLEEGGWLRPLVHALGNHNTLAPAEKVLDELLPFEADGCEQDPTSRNVGDDFEALLEKVSDRTPFENVTGWDPKHDHLPALSTQLSAPSARWETLERSKLACRLLSALVHVPAVRLPKAPSSLSSLLASDKAVTSDTSSSQRSKPPVPHVATQPDGQEAGVSPSPSQSNASQAAPLLPWQPPEQPAFPPANASSLPSGGSNGLSRLQTSTVASLLPAASRPDSSAANFEALPSSQQPHASASDRDRWDTRVMEEVVSIGFWDPGDRDHLRQMAAVMVAADGEEEAGLLSSKEEKAGLEMSMWIRQEERKLNRLRRLNNARIAELRRKAREALNRERDCENSTLTDEAVLEQWKALQDKQKEEEKRKKEQKEAEEQQRRMLKQQRMQEEAAPAAAAAAGEAQSYCETAPTPFSPMHGDVFLGDLPTTLDAANDKNFGLVGGGGEVATAPANLAHSSQLLQHAPLTMPTGISTPVLLEGPAGDHNHTNFAALLNNHQPGGHQPPPPPPQQQQHHHHHGVAAAYTYGGYYVYSDSQPQPQAMVGGSGMSSIDTGTFVLDGAGLLQPK